MTGYSHPAATRRAIAAEHVAPQTSAAPAEHPAPYAGGPVRDESAGAKTFQATIGEQARIALLTGGVDKPYAHGLATALTSRRVGVDFIGSDELESPELCACPHLRFLNLRKDQREDAALPQKIWRVLSYYARLLRYVAVAQPKILHILWNNKFEKFDRTAVMLYYRLLGKKIAITVHNVNAGKRDGNDSFLNRCSLWSQYHLADHIFVHTPKMKSELVEDFGVSEQAVTVIPFGFNNFAPHSDLTPAQAKKRLGIQANEKTILFFGNIVPYKGLEFLLSAFQRLAGSDSSYRLVVAGKPGRGCEKYIEEIQATASDGMRNGRITLQLEYVPDADTEIYFKAADLLALPYTQVFQSGVLFLSYSFGLPVVASDVGSLAEDVIPDKTGFLCQPRDPVSLAAAVETYFESDLFKTLNDRRREIRDYVTSRHSWSLVADSTLKIYGDLEGRVS